MFSLWLLLTPAEKWTHTPQHSSGEASNLISQPYITLHQRYKGFYHPHEANHRNFSLAKLYLTPFKWTRFELSLCLMFSLVWRGNINRVEKGFCHKYTSIVIVVYYTVLKYLVNYQHGFYSMLRLFIFQMISVFDNIL